MVLVLTWVIAQVTPCYQYNQNDSWNGPSFALLTNTDGSQFDLSKSFVQKVIALRDGSPPLLGYGMDDDVSQALCYRYQ